MCTTCMVVLGIKDCSSTVCVLYIYTAKIRSCFNLGVVISVSYSDEITVARSHVHTLAQHSLHTTT